MFGLPSLSACLVMKRLIGLVVFAVLAVAAPASGTS
jgi:hypothetical protein